MNVEIHLSSGRLYRWHDWLHAALSSREDIHVTAVIDRSVAPLPASLGLLLALERALHGTQYEALLGSRTVALQETPALARPNADLIIDLRGSGLSAPNGHRKLIPLYDGSPSEDAFWLALLDRRAPWLALSDTETLAPISIGIPSIEAAHIVSAGAETVLSRLIEGLVRTVGTIADGKACFSNSDIAPNIAHNAVNWGRSIASFGTTRLVEGAKKSLDDLLRRGPRWSVAWRQAPTRRAPLSATLSLDGFRHLPDDGRRYYADPFVVFDAGVHHVFVEEFPYATEKGVISHFTIGPDGKASRPTPVLERPFHLSYPQVFKHGGEYWMLPEAKASGALELYRADRFPDRWSLYGRLIEGRLSDATFLEHNGKLWVMAAEETYRSSAWDGLALFSADSLSGPWRPHPANPVLIDARAARPAGLPFIHNGALFRPAQDCTRGYGSAINIAHVTAFDGDTYEQRTVANITFKPGQDIMGPHTLNWANGLELIDVFSRPGK